MDRLTGLVAFVRVAEARSFSEAARRLGLSKSAVSKQMAALERRLGARLLNRTTRRLSLTEAGRRFYERAARILAEVDEAELEIARQAEAPRGRLRVNAPMTFGVMHLGRAVAEFLAEQPEVEVELELDDRYIDLVDEGYDLAVRIADLPDSSLVARKLAPARHVVCAAPAYLAKRGAPASPRDIAAHNCLVYSYRAGSRAWRFAGADGPMLAPPAGNLVCNNGEVLREAALAGLGLALAPTFIVGAELKSGALVEVLPGLLPQQHAIYAIWAHRRPSPKVRAFVDFLARRFGPEPYWD